MKNLKLLSLKYNKLIGLIPSSLGHLTNLTELDLDSNQMKSSIPPEIGNMKSLNYLYLSDNSIMGKIPSTICYLTQLSHLNLDWNQISATITLHEKFPLFSKKKKKNVNLSYNSLEGQILDVFKNYGYDTHISNKDLCGDIKSFPPCLSSSPNKNTSIDYKIKILIPLSFFLVLSLLWSRETKNGDIFSIWNYDGKIAYEDITKATEDFDIRYCIGIGSYVRIYKAQLPSGKMIALKKFHCLETEERSFDKSFKNEIKMLTGIRHRNIVKLHGYCLHKCCICFWSLSIWNGEACFVS
ncbi:mdis1-interacting receptor like kinase 2 [Quercus suber]|uniref:non-specific serine/threonine protein kinase n=1 Tax=Quercus suber TaxID=58331 RepID=A0AAW0J1N2_QUESU